MTVAERKAGLGSVTREYAVRAVRDRDEIRRLLEARRPYAAYALGQLDPLLFKLTEWWQAQSGDDRALLLHSRGGLGHATFLMGETGALEALLQLHPGARHTFLTCEVHHLDTLVRYFDIDQRQTMIRMQVLPGAFAQHEGDVRRLTGRDARDINRLYRTEGVPSFYTARQIDESVYFGAAIEGRLVAVAGTHVISPVSSIAVVGNVYTHPQWRGRGLAQATTSAVTEQLLHTCRQVVLSVDPTNTAAVRAYQRLGYIEVARLLEGAATRRDSTGAVTLARRTVARIRGRRANTEVVRLRT